MKFKAHEKFLERLCDYWPTTLLACTLFHCMSALTLFLRQSDALAQIDFFQITILQFGLISLSHLISANMAVAFFRCVQFAPVIQLIAALFWRLWWFCQHQQIYFFMSQTLTRFLYFPLLRHSSSLSVRNSPIFSFPLSLQCPIGSWSLLFQAMARQVISFILSIN